MSVLVPQHRSETEVAPVQSAGVVEEEVVAEELLSELHIAEQWGREDFAARSAEEGAEGFEEESKMAELGLERHSAIKLLKKGLRCRCVILNIRARCRVSRGKLLL